VGQEQKAGEGQANAKGQKPAGETGLAEPCAVFSKAAAQ
jgi:hypothetical protein